MQALADRPAIVESRSIGRSDVDLLVGALTYITDVDETFVERKPPGVAKSARPHFRSPGTVRVRISVRNSVGISGVDVDSQDVGQQIVDRLAGSEGIATPTPIT